MATSNLIWLGKQPEPDQGALQEGQAGGCGCESQVWVCTLTGLWDLAGELGLLQLQIPGWEILPPGVVKAPCRGLYTLTVVLSLPKWSSVGFLTLEMCLVHFERLVELCWPVNVSEHSCSLFFFSEALIIKVNTCLLCTANLTWSSGI